MSKPRARYTEGDVVRILKAAAKANVDVRVKIDTAGNIVIEAAGKNEANGSTVNGGSEANPWDGVLNDAAE